MILSIQIQTALFMILIGVVYGVITSMLLMVNKWWVNILMHMIYTLLLFVGLYQLNGSIWNIYYFLFIIIGILLYYLLYYPSVIHLLEYVKLLVLKIKRVYILAKNKILGIIKMKTRRRIKMPTKKKQVKTKKNRGIIWTIVLMLASCGFIYQIGKDVITTIQLKQEIASRDEQIQSIKDQIAQLEEEKENLGNPEYVKRFARGKYMVSKEGEQLFKLPSSNEDYKK